MWRVIVGVVAGLLAAFLVTWTIQQLGHAIWPAPPEVAAAFSDPDAFVRMSRDELAAVMAQVPLPSQAAVLVSWVLGALAGGFAAAYAAQAYERALAVGLGLLWTGSVGLMLALLPHPLWMAVGGLALCVPAALVGAELARRVGSREPEGTAPPG